MGNSPTILFTVHSACITIPVVYWFRDSHLSAQLSMGNELLKSDTITSPQLPFDSKLDEAPFL